MPAQQIPKKLPGNSGGRPKVKIDFRKEEEEESVSLSLVCTMPKLEHAESERLCLRSGTADRETQEPQEESGETKS